MRADRRKFERRGGAAFPRPNPTDVSMGFTHALAT
jgi:hypothetical protein